MRCCDIPMRDSNSSMRERLLQRNRICGVVSRITVGAMGLVSASLMIRYLGADLYGLWLVLSTIPGWVMLLEMGSGPVLRNSVALYNSRGDYSGIQKAVSSYVFVFFVVATIFAIGFLILASYIPFERFLNLDSRWSFSDVQQIKQSAIIIVLLSLLAVPLSAAGHLAYGLQRTYLADLASIVSSLTVVVGLAIVYLINPGRRFLMTVGCASILPQVVAGGLFTLLFYKMYRGIHPLVWHGWKSMSWLVNRQSMYFGGQHVASIIAPLSESFLVLQLLSPESVSQMGLIQRWYLPFSIVVVACLQPLQAAYVEARQRDDLQWTIASLQRLSFLSVLLIGIVGLGWLSLQGVYMRLISHDLVSNDVLLGMVALLRIALHAWSGTWGTFLFAVGRMGPMTFYSWIGVSLYIPLAFVMGQQFGSVGILGGAVLSYLPVPVSNYIEAKKVLKEWAASSRIHSNDKSIVTSGEIGLPSKKGLKAYLQQWVGAWPALSTRDDHRA